MQIEIIFTCRECELENTIRTDTSNYGYLWGSSKHAQRIENPVTVDLRCQCGHVSGEVALGYRFIRDKHQPSRDKEPAMGGDNQKDFESEFT